MSVKRYAIAAGAAALVFSGVYGAAAGLNVDGGVAQAGQASDLSCTEGVTVEGYAIEGNQAEVEPLSFGVKVTDINGDCIGKFVTARTLDANGDVLGNGVAEITGNSVTVKYEPYVGVPISDIEQVSIAIS